MKFFIGVVFGFLLATALIQSDTLEKRFAIATGVVIGAIAMLLLSIFNPNTSVIKTIEEEKKNDHWWKNGEKPPWDS